MLISLRKKRAYEDTSKAAAAICEERLKGWRMAPKTKPGAQQTLDRLVVRMEEELAEQILDIKRRYDSVQVQLTGVSAAELGQTGQGRVDWGRRVLTGALSLISPDYGISYTPPVGKGAPATRPAATEATHAPTPAPRK